MQRAALRSVTGFPPSAADTVGVAQAAVRGIQDLRAAVRFFRKDATTTNTYRVSPAYIAASGSSVGTFMALEVGYLDKASEVPAYVGLAGLSGIARAAAATPATAAPCWRCST